MHPQYQVYSDTFIYICFFFTIGRLYSNSLLANLNARESIRDQCSGVKSYSLPEISNGRTQGLNMMRQGHGPHASIAVQIETTRDCDGEVSPDGVRLSGCSFGMRCADVFVLSAVRPGAGAQDARSRISGALMLVIGPVSLLSRFCRSMRAQRALLAIGTVHTLSSIRPCWSYPCTNLRTRQYAVLCNLHY